MHYWSSDTRLDLADSVQYRYGPPSVMQLPIQLTVECRGCSLTIIRGSAREGGTIHQVGPSY